VPSPIPSCADADEYIGTKAEDEDEDENKDHPAQPVYSKLPLIWIGKLLIKLSLIFLSGSK